MGDFFQRDYVLNLDGQKFAGSVTDAAGNKTPGLRIAFEITKNLKLEPNQGKLSIWNLNRDSRQKLVQLTGGDTGFVGPTRGARVDLEAGYVSNGISLIFRGDLRRLNQRREGTDWISTLKSGDEEVAINTKRIAPKSFQPGTSVETILSYLVDQTGIASGNALEKARKGDIKGSLKAYANGFTAMGKAYRQLGKQLNNLGYGLSVQDGSLTALAPNEVLPLPAILLSPATGLKGAPEAGEKGTVLATSTLNGELIPGRQVVLQSLQYQGNYRVEEVSHVGDTHGPQWDSELILRRLNT